MRAGVSHGPMRTAPADSTVRRRGEDLELLATAA